MHATILSLLATILLILSASTPACCAPTSGDTKSGVVNEKAISTWKFKNEQEWIVDSIGRDIAEILVFAKYHGDSTVKQTPDSLEFTTTTVDEHLSKYRYQVTLPKTTEPLTYDFALAGYAWSPANYQPFSQKLIKALEIEPGAISVVPNNFLKVLSDADRKELYTENERISAALSKTPLDASLHRQAALLQAAFAMLEFAGGISDPRPALNRICTHLAIAQSLTPQSEMDIVGKIADIALENMSGREGVSITKNDLVAKSQTDATVKSWLRALKIRSSDDYRFFDEKNQTQLEATQFGRKLGYAFSADKVLDYMDKHDCSTQIQWMRIALYGGSSVSSGHRINTGIFPAELKDVAEDYNAFNHQEIKLQSQLIKELNRTSTRCLQTISGEPRLVPLSWDDVAAYHARLVVNAVMHEYHFFNRLYADPEAATAALKGAQTLLNGLNFLPLIYTQVSVDDKHKEFNHLYFSGVESLLVDRPELINSYAWSQVTLNGEKATPPVSMRTQPQLWFSPLMPMGTAFCFHDRIYIKSYKASLSELTRLRALSPQSVAICTQWVVLKYSTTPTSAQYREAFGALVDFEPEIMEQVAFGDYNNPQSFVPQMLKLAELEPKYYFALGEYCVKHNDPEKACQYFQLGLDKYKNRVAASNQSGWLVNYYYDHNQKEKAMAVAEDAAATYSAKGLTCLAGLYERMGELNKAEEIHLQAKMRYADYDELDPFYVRNRDKDKKYAEKAEPILKKIFPSGLRVIDTSDLKEPPAVGVEIAPTDQFADSIGLTEGRIVVALNDYKVDNTSQYTLVRRLATDYKIKCTYWDGNKYTTLVVPTVSEGKLGVSLHEFPKKK